MDVSRHFWVFFFICFCLIWQSIQAQEVCTKKTPCSCEFSNGTGIDLSDSAKSSFFTAQMYKITMNGSQYELSTYYYHPCFDVKPNVNASAVPGSCGNPVSICRRVDMMAMVNTTTDTFKFQIGNYEYMGSSNFTEFVTDGSTIIYNNGPSSTLMMLVCAETEDKLHVYSLDDPNKIVLAFYSRNACLRQLEAVGRSTGTTLLIIFFSLVIFYLVLGVCTKKLLMGAQGIEVIPNLTFWNDLPNLVKDGWAFTLNGFKLPPRGSGPTASPDPNSYDSI